MCKSEISKKLRLRQIFLRAILYLQRNSIRIELIKLSAAIAILTYKLCTGNLRANMRARQLIRLSKEIVMVEYRKRDITEYIKRKSNNSIT